MNEIIHDHQCRFCSSGTTLDEFCVFHKFGRTKKLVTLIEMSIKVGSIIMTVQVLVFWVLMQCFDVTTQNTNFDIYIAVIIQIS
jgi:hypothetical protein